MSKRTLRIALALLLSIPAIVVPAIPASASTPVVVDETDSHSFAGFNRSTASGAEEFEDVSPFGPFTQSGNQTQVLLSWTRAVSTSFLNCAPDQAVTYASDSVNNRVVLHYTIDKSGTPGPISSIEVRAPEVDAAPAGTSTDFPLNELRIIANVIDGNGTSTTNSLMLVAPTGNEDARWVGTFSPPVDVTDTFTLDVTFIGQVQPSLEGDPDVNSLNCPPPTDDLVESTDFGRSQLILQNQYVILNVEDQVDIEPPIFDPFDFEHTAIAGQLFELNISASDSSGNPVTFDIVGAPMGSSFVDNGDGTASLSFTPSSSDIGNSYDVTVAAFDTAGNSASQTFGVTVVAPGNQPPVLTPIGHQAVDEGGGGTALVEATDPDGDSLTFSITGMPAFVEFNDFGTGSGSFSFVPGFDDAGTYPITVRVSEVDDPSQFDDETFTLIVVDVNREPTLAPIGDVTLAENESITIPLNATDLDGDGLQFSALDLPSFGVLIDNGDGTGSLSLAPGSGAAGSYTMDVFVTDNGSPSQSDSETFTITVTNVNQPPVLEPIGDRALNEGESLHIPVSADDVDGDNLSFSIAGLPSGGSFVDNGDGTGSLDLFTTFGDAGTHTITIRVTDDGDPALFDEETFTVTVIEVNQSPTLNPLAPVSVAEGETASIQVVGSDPDGDTLTIDGVVPLFCAIVDNLDGTGSVECAPGHEDAGSYDITVSITDDGQPPLSDEDTFTLTVTDVNRPPVINGGSPGPVNEGETLTFTLDVGDPDGDDITINGDAPAFCVINDNGDNTGSVRCDPESGDADSYPITITVTDDGTPPLSDTDTITITVFEINTPPVLAPIGPVTLNEGESATLSISGTDGDDDVLVITASMPDFASVQDNGDGTGTLTIQPGFDDSGLYSGTITITDDGTPPRSDSDTFTITVVDVNRAPVLTAPDAVQVDEGVQSSVLIVSTDPDDDGLTLTYEGPDFCLLNDDGEGSGELTCDPPFDASGLYDGLITVTDDGDPALIDSSTVQITVTNINRLPNVNSIADLTMEEGEVRGRGVIAGDADADILTVTLVNGPGFTSLTDNGGGRADIEFTPGENDAGTYTVTVRVTDDGNPNLSVDTSFTVVVNEVNRPPVIDPVETVEIVQGEPVFGTLSATDPDGDPITFSLSGPSFCTLTNSDIDDTAALECDTTTAPSGVHTVTVTASDGLLQSSTTFDLRILPAIDANGPYTVILGDTVQVAATGPANGAFEWDLNGDGTFETQGQTADFDSAGLTVGAYQIAVRVTSFDGTTSNTDTAMVNVIAGPNPPVIVPIPDSQQLAGGPFPFFQAVRATDADDDPLTLTATMEPLEDLYLGFTDNGDGTGEVRINNAAPPGKYTVTVTASDGGQSTTEVFVLTLTPEIDAGGPRSIFPGDSATITPSSVYATQFSYDANGDGIFEATGPSYTFSSSPDDQPGTRTISVKGCLDDPDVCAIVDVEIVIDPAPTFEDLQDLTRDAVSNFVVERTLVTILGLAEFFDTSGAFRAAQALLEAYIRLVIRLALGGFIGIEASELMVDAANYMLSQYEE